MDISEKNMLLEEGAPKEGETPPEYTKPTINEAINVYVLAKEGEYNPFFKINCKPGGWWRWSPERRIRYVRGVMYTMYPTLRMWLQVDRKVLSPPEIKGGEPSTIHTAMMEWRSTIRSLCPVCINSKGNYSSSSEMWVSEIRQHMATEPIV